LNGCGGRFVHSSHPLFLKDAEYQPYVEKLDKVEKGLTELEQTVALLDDYTRKLGRFIPFQSSSSTHLPFSFRNQI
jgi:hypothetical protein